MEQLDNLRDQTRRPVRNKRCNRRAYAEEKRPPKRLFTPEIKRFLKDWLIRRRENPYPSRDEKKTLAVQTGLTYIQICNWFANWRRKLKNAGKEPQRKTWGHLIKTYNSQAQGNVEHFSICSDDSIWEEPDSAIVYEDASLKEKSDFMRAAHDYTHSDDSNSPTYPEFPLVGPNNNHIFRESKEEFSQKAKYKNHIMEKYLRDCQKPENFDIIADKGMVQPASMMSKWLESAANFRPNENNYLNWTLKVERKKHNKKCRDESDMQHGKAELDAAEALTRLANAHAALKLCSSAQ